MIATMPLVGEMAGLATAVLWAVSALAWSFAGRQVGAVAVTCLRITLASVILSAAHWAAFGAPFPTDLPAEAMWLLLASGAMGAGFGDLCLFRGLVLIGPRLGMMIMSLVPFLSAAIAYFTPLHETLGAWAAIGMALTVGGVAWVVAEPRGRGAWPAPPRHFAAGVLLCLAGAVLIAGGMVLAKMGMRAGPGGGVGAMPATLVRVVAGTVVAWVAVPLLGRTGATMRALRHARAMAIIIAGTVVGPVIGIWLSMEAIKRTAETGVAAALMGTSPIMMIPIVHLAYAERPTLRTLLGTVAAVGGVAVLMLRQMLNG
jgi:drug/metabolite transporter (DMT)-like permease